MGKGIKLCLAFTFLLVVSLSLVAAADITITVKGEPFHNVIFRVLDANTQAELETMYQEADVEGKTSFAFTTDRSELSFIVWEKHPLTKVKVKTEYFDIPVEEVISLGFDPEEEETPDPPVEPVEEEGANDGETQDSDDEETVDLEEQESERNNLTGFFIKEGGTPGAGAYLIGVIILAAIALMVFMAVRMKKAVGKASDNTDKKEKKDRDDDDDDFERELKDAEEKLKEAQREIKELRSKKSGEMEKALDEFEKAKKRFEKTTGKKVEVSER